MADVSGTYGINSNTAATGVNGTDSTKSTAKKKSSSLDMQDFMKLLAAQMKYQSIGSSSSSSADNSQYITEMALFSAIQSMNTLTSQSTKQYAASLVGSDVVLSVVNSVTGQKETVKGTVSKATFDSTSNDSFLQIGDKSYNVSTVAEVLGYNPSNSSGSAAGETKPA